MSTNAHRLDRLLAEVLDSPWALTAPMLQVIADILVHRLVEGAHARSATELAALLPPAPTAKPAPTPQAVAVIPLHGTIAPRMNLMTEISGGVTLDEVTGAVQAAVASPDIGTIVLDIDSPGGSVRGCNECADVVLAARAVKPVIAVANYQMCSAAYWIGSCATKVVASPSAEVGSIGVLCMHDNITKALEARGIERTVLYAGKHKAVGNPAKPLSEDDRAQMQALIDEAYDDFVTYVARGRGIEPDQVRTGYKEGFVARARSALACGLVDEIASLDDILMRCGASPTAAPTLAPPAPVRHAAGAHKATGQDLAELQAIERALLELDMV